jgi:Dockerin type I domain/PEP-CTERM motif
MYQRDWWDGAFWWNWETGPGAGGLTNTDYTPQNKPVLDVLADFYIPFILGDVNHDGTVDLLDLNAVKNHFGEDGSAGGDANGDGVVNLEDLNAVKNNFGASSAGFSSVPEPTSFGLLLVAAGCVGALRKNGRAMRPRC